MEHKDFIFAPGYWLGEGKITFSASSEFIKFYTKWQITEEASGILKATQTVEMQGIEEHVINQITIKDKELEKFTIILENQMVGSIEGKGRKNPEVIAWEFRQAHFEGFEVYEKQENGDYFFHAEYGAPDQFRTLVEGLIWHKS